MTLYYHVAEPANPSATFLGGYTLGDRPVIRGVATLVVDSPPFYPEVVDPKPPGVDSSPVRAWDVVAKVVHTTWDVIVPDPAAAHSNALDRTESHQKRVSSGGTTHNSEPLSTAAPTGATLEASGTARRMRRKDRRIVTYANQGELRAAVSAIGNHYEAAMKAQDAHDAAIDAILADGGLTDQQKVDQLRAYDVTADIVGSEWPPNPL